MDVSVVEMAGKAAAPVSLEQAIAVRERLGHCLNAMLEAGKARHPIDETLPRDLRAVAPVLTEDEVTMSAEALLGVAMQCASLEPAEKPTRAPYPAYRILGALLSGLSISRGIATANKLVATVDKLMAAVGGGAGDRMEHMLVGLLGSLSAAPTELYVWLADRVRALPDETDLVRCSASSIPWLVNRIPLMPESVAKQVFEAALARCKTLTEQDRVPMWLAFAAPACNGVKRDLVEKLNDGGAKIAAGALIEDENLPVPAPVRNLERQLNLLLAANIPALRNDADKQAALRHISSHLSVRDLELCAQILTGKAPFMLGALFSGRSQEEATLLARYYGATAEQSSDLLAILENLGDAPLEVYEPFVRQAVAGDALTGPIQLSAETPEETKALLRQLAPTLVA